MLFGNNSTETKVIFLYVGCLIIPETLKIIIHLLYRMNIKLLHWSFTTTHTAFRDCRVRFSLF